MGATTAALGATLGDGVSQAWQQLAEAGLLIMHVEHDQLPSAGLKRSQRSPTPFVELLLSLTFALEFSGSLLPSDLSLSGLTTSSTDFA